MSASTAPFTIRPATEDEVRSGVVGQQLRAFNYRFVGEYPQQQPIRLNAVDAGGALLGGLRAFVFLHWLRVEVLWVADAARRQGVGSGLLRQAEQDAIALGARGSALETFDWQAPEFYRKQGYAACGRIEDYVDGYALWMFSKRL
ncbi:MAG: GNAT family N-acetyltransferase [Pseudomonadota bacterium]